MFPAFLILIVLILASPLTMFVDGNLMIGIEATVMAVATGLVARESEPADTQSLLEFSRLILVVTVIPALWMIIQVLPSGYLGTANPVWESTQQALGHAVVGSIAIDTGAAILELIEYIAAVAIVFGTTAMTIDRSRADQTLFVLLVAITISCMPFTEPLSRLNTISDKSLDAGALRNAAELGVLLAVTTVIGRLEQWQSSRSFSKSKLIASVAASIISLAICGSALAMHWTGDLGFSLALAVTVLLAIALVQGLRIGIWGAAAIAAIVLSIGLSIVWIRFGGRAIDLMIAFSDNDLLVATTQRILADAPWFGSGAGSFETLANLYRQPSDAIGVTTASTAAAKIAIELGRPMLWIVTVTVLFAATVLLRGALRRGRNSFYPALGASCLIALLVRAFGDANIFAPAVLIVSAAILGLALAQSSGRKTGLT